MRQILWVVFFTAGSNYRECSPAHCLSFSKGLLSAVRGRGDTMGLNTTSLIKQSFQTLARCSRVYRKRRGSSGRGGRQEWGPVPRYSLWGEEGLCPLEVVGGGGHLCPGQHIGFDGVGRRRIVRNVITSRLGCYWGVDYGNGPEVSSVCWEWSSWAGAPSSAWHQPPFAVLPPWGGCQEVQ